MLKENESSYYKPVRFLIPYRSAKFRTHQKCVPNVVWCYLIMFDIRAKTSAIFPRIMPAPTHSNSTFAARLRPSCRSRFSHSHGLWALPKCGLDHLSCVYALALGFSVSPAAWRRNRPTQFGEAETEWCWLAECLVCEPAHTRAHTTLSNIAQYCRLGPARLVHSGRRPEIWPAANWSPSISTRFRAAGSMFCVRANRDRTLTKHSHSQSQFIPHSEWKNHISTCILFGANINSQHITLPVMSSNLFQQQQQCFSFDFIPVKNTNTGSDGMR